MDKFQISCPGCTQQLRLAETQRGKQVRCPTCKTVFIVRAGRRASAESAVESPAAPAAPTHRDKPPQSRPAPQIEPEAEAPAAPKQRPLTAQERRAARMAARRATAAPGTASPLPAKKTGRRSAAAAATSPAAPKPPRRRRKARPRPQVDYVEEVADEYLEDTYVEDVYEDDEIEDYDDPFSADDDYADDTYFAPEPPPQRKRRKRRSSGNTGQIVAVATAILVAVGAIGGLGFAAWKFLPGLGGNIVDLSYLPEDSAGFVRVNVSSVVNSQLFQKHITGNPVFESAMPLQALEQQTGLTLSDIKSVTVGFGPGGHGGNPFGSLSGRSPGTVMVIRTHTAFPESALSAGAESETYHDQTLYSKAGLVAWLPDATTLVAGSHSQVTAAIDQQQQHRFRQFDFASTGYDILVVGEPSTVSSTFNSPLGPSMRQEARGVAVGFDLNSGADVMFQVNCQSRGQARASVEKTEAERAQAKLKFEQQMSRGAVDPKLVAGVKQLIDNVSISSSGSVVTMKLHVSGQLIDQMFSQFPGF